MADVTNVVADKAAKNRISGTDFVRAYFKVQRAGGTNADLAKETGLVYGSVVQRIKSLTERGTVLTPLKRAPGGNRVNVDELNALIAELNAEAEASE